MKTSIKLKLAAAAVVLAVPFAIVLGNSASGIGEGQIERGDFYYSKNLSTNSGYGDPTSAAKCQQILYKVRMHNPGVGTITNVRMHVNLPATKATQNVSTVTITADNAFPVTVSDTATVNISTAETVSYVAGTTQLLNAQNNVIANLPDGITNGEINIGSVGVSLNEIRFVQFKADISCETPPPPTPVYSCDSLTVAADKDRTVKVTGFSTTAKNGAVYKNAVLTWGDNSGVTAANLVGQTHQYGADGTYTITAVAHFTVNGEEVTAGGPACQTSVKFSPNKPPVVPPPVTPPTVPPATTTPGKLVNTGPGSVLGIFALVSAVGAYLHRRFISRRLVQD